MLVIVVATAVVGNAALPVYREIKPDVFMKQWLVLGPIHGPIPASDDNRPDEAAQRRVFATDYLKAAGGEADVRPIAGRPMTIEGKEYTWRSVASSSAIIDLSGDGAGRELDIAYAWAEIEMGQASKMLFGIGSDDAIKVWLNGRLIHENWVDRAARKDDDLVELPLRQGTNQLLLKVLNFSGDSGFVCRPLGAAGLEEKLVGAASRGELEAVKELLERNVSVNGKDKRGLTPWQAARIQGQREVAEYLRSMGADGRMPPDLEQVVDATFQDIVQDGWSGAAVLVARDGKVLFEKGYGLANLEHRVPVTPATKFRIGSITKQFIAAAILKLQEEGKLDVTNQLSRFFPDFSRGGEVTIHHLLTHTSGIHSYTSKPDFMETAPLFIKPDDLIRSFKDDPYDFDPGQRWSYNNSGYFLLGAIIEQVSGASYGEYLRTNFFEPLGMTQTGVHDGMEVLEHDAQGYAFAGGRMKKALNWDMSRAGGAGALYSTVGDLYRWNEALFNGRVLSEASLKSAFTPVRIAGNESGLLEDGYGYGWAIGTLRGTRLISHGGGLNGFNSFLLRAPDEKLTVTVLANASPPPPGLDSGTLAHGIAQLYLAEKLDWRPAQVAIKTVSSNALESCTGRYDYGAAILTVTREGGRLFAQLTGQSRYEIFPTTETEFIWKVVDARVTFVKNEKGAVIQAIHRQGGQTIHAPRLPELSVARIDPELLEACVGRYDYGGPSAILSVTRDGDRLFAQLTGQPKFEIVPKSETEFFWKETDARITFVKDASGKVTKGIHQQGGQTFDAPRIE